MIRLVKLQENNTMCDKNKSNDKSRRGNLLENNKLQTSGLRNFVQSHSQKVKQYFEIADLLDCTPILLK